MFFKKLLKNIDYNFNQVVIGLSIVSMGLFLWLDKNYFKWPPELQPMMNSEYSDLVFIAIGVVMLFCALSDNRNKVIRNIDYIAAGGATILLLIEQLWQVLFAKNMDMAIAVIFDVLLFVLIIRCAYDS